MKSIGNFDKKGFTLVESIVAGAITIFVLLTGMTLYNLNADQIRNSFTRCQIRVQYQVLIEQIERSVRQSKVILPSNATDFFDTDTTSNSTDIIYCIDPSGTTLGAYRRSGTQLLELKGSFTPLKVGSNAVTVLNCGANKTFTIAGDRKSVTLNLSVVTGSGSFKDTVVSKKETFVCRN
jgi:type II secretory pathway pseudopilin PulG